MQPTSAPRANATPTWARWRQQIRDPNIGPFTGTELMNEYFDAVYWYPYVDEHPYLPLTDHGGSSAFDDALGGYAGFRLLCPAVQGAGRDAVRPARARPHASP